MRVEVCLVDAENGYTQRFYSSPGRAPRASAGAIAWACARLRCRTARKAACRKCNIVGQVSIPRTCIHPRKLVDVAIRDSADALGRHVAARAGI